MSINSKQLYTSSPSFSVIIVAGGQGIRFGADKPKQYISLFGKTILRHTIEAFARHPSLRHIQVVIAPDHTDFYEQSCVGLSPALLNPPVYGGVTRQESVYNGLMALKNMNDNDIIFIHDAARPCIDNESINRLLNAFDHHHAASLVLPVSETLRKGKEGILTESLDRTDTYAMQTPQAFRYGLIKNAHITQRSKNFTDDTTLMAAMGHDVAMVMGTRENIKITTTEDVTMAEKYLMPTMIPRTGIGFDVHAFGDAASSVRIGGVDIPHTHALKGHSDADVLIHAIADALYGAVAEGDIGVHFPPSNADLKGMDSAIFLNHAVKTVHDKGGQITHVDAVILCEAPKIMPHRDAIRHRLANLMGLKITKVSVKATTTEQLGFTGRREGIAAQAIVTVLMPLN